MEPPSKKTKWIHCISLALLGCFLAVLGCGMILYTYAFASIVHPSLAGWDRWSLILQKMLLTPTVVLVVFSVVAFGVGIATIVSSLKMAFSSNPFNPKQIVSIGIYTALLLGTALLLLLLM